MQQKMYYKQKLTNKSKQRVCLMDVVVVNMYTRCALCV